MYTSPSCLYGILSFPTVSDEGAIFTFGKTRFADNLSSKFWIRNDAVVKVRKLYNQFIVYMVISYFGITIYAHHLRIE